MKWGRLLVIAAVVAIAAGCQPANQRARPAKQSVQISVVDESGAPITPQ